MSAKKFFTYFPAPRTLHSEKPEDFYEILRRVVADRRLGMFGRRKIDGFVSWGNEVIKLRRSGSEKLLTYLLASKSALSDRIGVKDAQLQITPNLDEFNDGVQTAIRFSIWDRSLALRIY